MRRDPLARLSIRAAVLLSFGLILGLWVLTGYALSARMVEIEEQTTALTARYIRAQDALSAIRMEINVSSIALRDTLLAQTEEARSRHRRRLEEAYADIGRELDHYTPVLAGASREPADRLRKEIAVYRDVVHEVMDAAHVGPEVHPSEWLARYIAPRRAAALEVSEELRRLNRVALVEHQAATAAIHRAAQHQWWYGLGVALAATLVIALSAILYAGRLESRLQAGRVRDARQAQDLQQLSSRLVDAQEDERRIISRELHDEIGQVLSAIGVEAQLAARAIDQPADAHRALEEVQQLADRATRTVRDLSQLLRPAQLDDLGLGPAVDALVRGFARRHAAHVDLVQHGMTERLDPRIEVAAYRIVQEALTNAARHANAQHCIVRLINDGIRLQVTVTDDGAGLAQAASETHGRTGLGLISMRERALSLGGTFEVFSESGRGVRVTAEIPLTPRARASELPESGAGGAVPDALSVAHG